MTLSINKEFFIMTEKGIVFMTAASREEADKIADLLVEKRLAACVQIISDIKSVYWWEGKICRDDEVFFIAKTTKQLFPDLTEEVKKLHSYKVPEIVFVPIQVGSKEYMEWIHKVTKEST
jgi:periplasmic divalent cation tolerance protein